MTQQQRGHMQANVHREDEGLTTSAAGKSAGASKRAALLCQVDATVQVCLGKTAVGPWE